MEKYDNLGLVGEGSYGMVMKCRRKDTGELVAVKKFLDSEDDKTVKKIALREIRMLRTLKHDNLVNLLDVFRRKKRLYLVFEYIDYTVLDRLEKCPNGLDEMTSRKILFQVIRGIEFCHTHNTIHRDVKPENILVSRDGVVKICDFGFARHATSDQLTDYVATRWYRAPELLVGDLRYGRPIDIWAIGCLAAEMLTGEPLFPGDSDIDQLYHVVRCLGNLPQRYREIFAKNPLFSGMRAPEARSVEPLERKVPRCSRPVMDLIKRCLQLEADDRPSCSELLRLEYFQANGFATRFAEELRVKIKSRSEQHGSAGATAPDTRQKKQPHHHQQQQHPQPQHHHLTPAAAATEQSASPRQASPASVVGAVTHQQERRGHDAELGKQSDELMDNQGATAANESEEPPRRVKALTQQQQQQQQADSQLGGDSFQYSAAMPPIGQSAKMTLFGNFAEGDGASSGLPNHAVTTGGGSSSGPSGMRLTEAKQPQHHHHQHQQSNKKNGVGTYQSPAALKQQQHQQQQQHQHQHQHHQQRKLPQEARGLGPLRDIGGGGLILPEVRGAGAEIHPGAKTGLYNPKAKKGQQQQQQQQQQQLQ